MPNKYYKMMSKIKADSEFKEKILENIEKNQEVGEKIIIKTC